MTLRAFALLASVTAAAAWSQDHSYTSADIEEGSRRYRISCIGCHGADGTSVAGIDLGRAKFKRVSTDEDLVRVILNGVPGTGMPPTTMPPPRALMIVAYLRTMSKPADGAPRSIAAASGDPTRGKALFEGKAGCAGCHRIRGSGGRTGPDLSDAGALLRAMEVETSILDPDADFILSPRPYLVTLRDGATVVGPLLNQDSYTLQMRDSQGNLRSIDRREVRQAGATRSPMPSYRGKLDPQELADVIAYVVAQRGVQE